MVQCKYCKKEVQWNKNFFDSIRTTFQKGWNQLNTQEKSQAAQLLKEKGIYMVADSNNTPIIVKT